MKYNRKIYPAGVRFNEATQPKKYMGDLALDLKGLDLALERAKLIESELLKESGNHITRNNVAIAAMLAFCSAFMTARDTLLWRAITLNTSVIEWLRWETGFFVTTAIVLSLGYLAGRPKIVPRLNEEYIELATSEERLAKFNLLTSLLVRNVQNDKQVRIQGHIVNWGIFFLICLVITTLRHTVSSGIMKPEVEHVIDLHKKDSSTETSAPTISRVETP